MYNLLMELWGQGRLWLMLKAVMNTCSVQSNIWVYQCSFHGRWFKVLIKRWSRRPIDLCLLHPYRLIQNFGNQSADSLKFQRCKSRNFQHPVWILFSTYSCMWLFSPKDGLSWLFFLSLSLLYSLAWSMEEVQTVNMVTEGSPQTFCDLLQNRNSSPPL